MPRATLAAIFLGLLAAAFLASVSANTEIANFAASESADGALSQELELQWPVLRHGAAERLWRLPPGPLGTPLDAVCASAAPAVGTCPHELWLALDLDDARWRAYSRFTLRISWPASSPADFSIAIYSADALVRRGSAPGDGPSTRTRRQYARIRLVDTGVRAPSSSSGADAPLDAVPFIVLLEPLYLGVLPASVAPILLFLAAVLSFAAVAVVPVINRYISAAARDARTELAALETQERKAKSIWCVHAR